MIGFLSEAVSAIRESWIVKSAIHTGLLLLVLVLVLLVLLGVTFLLKWFFGKDPTVDRAHRIVISLLTMVGVVILMIGGLLGLFLPIIPGVLLIFFALALMRKYYRNAWLDAKLHALQVKLRIKKGVLNVRERIRKREKP